MPATKEYENDADRSDQEPCRKILTLSGLKDRKEHRNRIFSPEKNKGFYVEKDAR